MKLKRPTVEITQRPDDRLGYQKEIICPACGREIEDWTWGKQKCPSCGTEIKVSK